MSVTHIDVVSAPSTALQKDLRALLLQSHCGRLSATMQSNLQCSERKCKALLETSWISENFQVLNPKVCESWKQCPKILTIECLRNLIDLEVTRSNWASSELKWDKIRYAALDAMIQGELFRGLRQLAASTSQ